MILTSFDVTKTIGILKSGVCLKACPTEKDKNLVDCKSNANYKCEDHKSYPTKDVFDFCLPTSKEDLPKADQEGFDYLQKWLKNSRAGSFYEDLYKSSTSIYVSMALALVWCIVYIYLMSWFAEALAWCCVFLIWVGLGAGTYFTAMKWLDSKKAVEDFYNDPQYEKMTEKEKQ